MKTVILLTVICLAVFSAVVQSQSSPFYGPYSEWWFRIIFGHLYGLPCEGVQAEVSNVNDFTTRYSLDLFCKFLFKPRYCDQIVQSLNSPTCQVRIVAQAVIPICQCPGADVNGGWSNWVNGAVLTSCSVTCGTGTERVRQNRECNNPPQSGDGLACSGLSTQDVDQDCILDSCPADVNGGWSNWVNVAVLTSCSVTCGTGTELVRQNRECNNPPQSGNGLACSGLSTQDVDQDCILDSCPADVNGGWSNWVNVAVLTSCSVTCGTGTELVRQNRECNNPPQSGNGLACSGLSTQDVDQDCILDSCPADVNGGWSNWVNVAVLTSCSVTCGTGTELVRQNRECNNPPQSGNGLACSGLSTQDVDQDCILDSCPADVNGGWSNWVNVAVLTSCSVTCGTGTELVRQNRECNNPPQSGNGLACSGLSTQDVDQDCILDSCPVDGIWSEWVETPTSECTVTCGGGQRNFTRTRTCTNPAPQFGGAMCPGVDTENIIRTCNEEPLCPIHGGWSSWSQGGVGPCSAECGGGTQIRTDTRTCTMPTPLHGGDPCVGDSTVTVTLDCNTQACGVVVNGGWSDYTFVDVSECSTPCGGGRKMVNKTRFCNNPAPSNGGSDCVGDAVESTFELDCNNEDVNICTQPACLTSRIVGGNDAEPCQYPFVVGVRRFDTYTCGGTLIGLNKVLTAAHCVYLLQPSQLEVEVGKHCRSTANSESYNANNPNMEVMTVDAISVHPDYNPNSNLFHDIAVLLLSKDAVITNCRQTVKMAETGTVTQTGRDCTVMGWGVTEWGGISSDLLLHVQLQMYDSADCRLTFPTTASFVSNNIICAANGVAGGRDACNGDSGGPLVCLDNNEWVQYGIVSSGVECARVGQTGIYTEVADYRSWVDQQFP